MSTGDRLVRGRAREDGGPVVESARGDKDNPVVVTRRAAGDPGRGRVLFLHGLSNSSSVWDACVEQGRRTDGPELWAADLPWRGRSVAGWSARGDLVPYMGDALRAVPGGAGVVVAHSMGANVLMEFLARRIEEGLDPFTEFGVHGMVLVAPFYRRAAEEFDWASLAYSVDNMAPLIAEGIRVHAGDRVSGATHAAPGRAHPRLGRPLWLDAVLRDLSAHPRPAPGTVHRAVPRARSTRTTSPRRRPRAARSRTAFPTPSSACCPTAGTS